MTELEKNLEHVKHMIAEQEQIKEDADAKIQVLYSVKSKSKRRMKP